MNLRVKLPIMAASLVIVPCLALGAVMLWGVGDTMRRSRDKAAGDLQLLIEAQLQQGVAREREQVEGLVDTAICQTRALAASPTVVRVLIADRDERMRIEALRPIMGLTQEIGESFQTRSSNRRGSWLPTWPPPATSWS